MTTVSSLPLETLHEIAIQDPDCWWRACLVFRGLGLLSLESEQVARTRVAFARQWSRHLVRRALKSWRDPARNRRDFPFGKEVDWLGLGSPIGNEFPTGKEFFSGNPMLFFCQSREDLPRRRYRCRLCDGEMGPRRLHSHALKHRRFVASLSGCLSDFRVEPIGVSRKNKRREWSRHFRESDLTRGYDADAFDRWTAVAHPSATGKEIFVSGVPFELRAPRLEIRNVDRFVEDISIAYLSFYLSRDATPLFDRRLAFVLLPLDQERTAAHAVYSLDAGDSLLPDKNAPRLDVRWFRPGSWERIWTPYFAHTGRVDLDKVLQHFLHSVQPNCKFVEQPKKRIYQLVAQRAIPAGELLTLNHNDCLAPTFVRGRLQSSPPE